MSGIIGRCWQRWDERPEDEEGVAASPAIRPQQLEGEPVIAISRKAAPTHHDGIAEFFADFGGNLTIVADAFVPPVSDGDNGQWMT